MTMLMQLVSKPLENSEKNILDAVYEVGDKALRDLIIKMHKNIVAPWELEEDKPEFIELIEFTPTGSVLSVEMDAQAAEEATLSVWQLLNREDGTEVRPMHVSGPPDKWESKTSVRGLESGPGAGHTTGVYPPWADGIEGRMFDLAVAEDSEAEIDGIVRLAYEKALDREFAG